MAAIVITNAEEGCCGDPTPFVQVKQKLYEWALATAMPSMRTALGYKSAGYKKDAAKLLEAYEELLVLVAYLLTVYSDMLCAGDCWRNHVSEGTIRCWIDRFSCLGIDITCALQDTHIYFPDCNETV